MQEWLVRFLPIVICSATTLLMIALFVPLYRFHRRHDEQWFDTSAGYRRWDLKPDFTLYACTAVILLFFAFVGGAAVVGEVEANTVLVSQGRAVAVFPYRTFIWRWDGRWHGVTVGSYAAKQV